MKRNDTYTCNDVELELIQEVKFKDKMTLALILSMMANNPRVVLVDIHMNDIGVLYGLKLNDNDVRYYAFYTTSFEIFREKIRTT